MPSMHQPGAERRRPENTALRARNLIVTEDWLSRCARRVCGHDASIQPDDADELAWFMYCQDRYRRMEPERAVDALFADQDRWRS